MPWYNLLFYSKNYQKTGSLWNYYRDEPNSGAEGGINYSIKNSESCSYKTSLTGNSKAAILNYKVLKLLYH